MKHADSPKAFTSSGMLLAFAAMIALAAAPGATAQQAGAATPRATLAVYDAVSIHPNNSQSGSTRLSTDPGILKFTNVKLRMMLAYAYGIREGLIEGLPERADSAHYDVYAKVVEPDMAALKAMTREQRAAMLVPVLEDRFGVKVHTETKIQPVYELVLAKGGPKFKEYVAPAGDTDPRGPNMGAGLVNTRNLGGPFDMTATGVPMSTLTERLSGQVDKTVIDKTGLPGKYDLELKWTPDNARMNGAAVEPTDQAPDIYTALQEQLGVKLVVAKGPVATLVVDQVKQPTEN